MILACPSCATRFEVADHELGAAGRRVRCSVCDREWRVPPVEGSAPRRSSIAEAMSSDRPAEPPNRRPTLPTAALPAGASGAVSRPAIANPAPRARGKIGPALLIALVAVVTVGALAVVWRDLLIARYPDLAPYYRALGLEPGRAPTAS